MIDSLIAGESGAGLHPLLWRSCRPSSPVKATRPGEGFADEGRGSLFQPSGQSWTVVSRPASRQHLQRSVMCGGVSVQLLPQQFMTHMHAESLPTVCHDGCCCLAACVPLPVYVVFTS